MKIPKPITIYDLECTAKDAKDGIIKYRGVIVCWDNDTDSFRYYNQNYQTISKECAMVMIDDVRK